MITIVAPSPTASPSPATTVSARPSPSVSTGALADPGVFDDRKGFAVEMIPNGNYTYYLHKAGDDNTPHPAPAMDVNQTCSVTTLDTVTPKKNSIICNLEADELDLWYNGVNFNVNIPYPMCSYLWVSPYWYWNWPTGKAMEGNPWAAAPVPVTTLYKKVDNTTTPPTVTLKVDGVGVAAGAAHSYFDSAFNPSCAPPMGDFDFSTGAGTSKGPNCCLGNYTYTVETINPQPAPNPPTDTIVTNKQSWGGNPGQCAGGAGMTGSPKDPNGLPMPTVDLVTGNGYNKSFKITGPGFVNHPGMDIYIANFFDTQTAGYYTAAAAPNGAAPRGLSKAPGTNLTPHQDYVFACLDAAHEVTAQITIKVRKWNMASELAKFVDDPTTGDPHMTLTQDPITGAFVDSLPAWDSDDLLLAPINPLATPGDGYPKEP